MGFFRKKGVVIEARELNRESAEELAEWSGGKWVSLFGRGDRGEDISHVVIPTLEGDHRADLGDWIIKGVEGEFYPCKPNIFAKTYEDADAEPEPIDMLIFCPNCGKQHIDRSDPVCGRMDIHDEDCSPCQRSKGHDGEHMCSPMDDNKRWTNPVHKSHTCRKDDSGCGKIFRVADVPTNGVAEIKTRGKDDTWPEVAA
jgi:hypothetical protein